MPSEPSDGMRPLPAHLVRWSPAHLVRWSPPNMAQHPTFPPNASGVS
ncbi:TPA: hypothetical protein ACKNYJ_001580 [Neisseria gonorrhoeae]